MGCRVTRVTKDYMGCIFFKSESLYYMQWREVLRGMCLGCRVTRVTKGYMGCNSFLNQNPYTIYSREMNSEGCVFGLQGCKGYKRLHGLHFVLKSESLCYN